MNARNLIVAGLGLLLSAQAYCLGLGRIEVYSHLNEPFSARIPIIGADPSYYQSVFVVLADPEQFQKMGVERRFILATLQFDVVEDEQSGPRYVDVSSVQPIREPFLDLLLELASPDGRLVQQYTVLLDPAPIGQAGGTPSSEYAKAPAAYFEPSASALISEAPAATGLDAAVPATADRHYGPVSPGETAWSVALALRSDPTISAQQMMLALLRINPEAFAGGRLDGLKTGATLRIPTRAEITRVDKAQALAEVKRRLGE